MSSPRVVVIVQARMGASRLPGKVLKRAGSRSLLEHLARRLARSATASEVLVATTEAAADQAVADEAARLGLEVFRGDEQDVLARYAGAAAQADAEVVVRVTADCPLLDPAELDRVVQQYLAAGTLDYASNQAGADRRIPHGQDVEVFSRAALERAHREARLPGEREHVTPYLYSTEGRFQTRVFQRPGPDLSAHRLTVDTPEDLALVQAIVEALGPDAPLDEVCAFLDAHPEVAALNADVKQKGIESDGERRARRVAGRLLIGRADAGQDIGFGHVARLGALLEAWVELGGSAALVGSVPGGQLADRLERGGVALHPSSDPQLGDALALAKQRGAAAVAVDGYRFDADALARLREQQTSLALDDEARFTPPADLVLNQNLGFDAGRYRGGPRLLVGADYVLLRGEIRRLIDEPVKPSQTVLVSFGGSDPRDMSLPVARALLDAGLGVEVIAGPAMRKESRAALAAMRGLVVHHDPPALAERMRQAGLAVAGAGSTIYELMALGVPALAVVVAENQRPVAEGAASAGAVVALAGSDPGLARKCAESARQLLDDPTRLQAMATRGKALIDGRGVWRVIDALLDCIDRRKSTR